MQVANPAYRAAGPNIAPTTEAYFADPNTSWEDYLFQRARREKGNLYFIDGQWRQTEVERHDDHMNPMGHNFLGFQTWGDPFENSDEMVHYIYDGPGEGQYYDTAERLYNYQKQSTVAISAVLVLILYLFQAMAAYFAV